MGKHLTLADRESIEIHLNRGELQKEIATVLKRSESSISNEIRNYSVTKEGTNKRVYLALEADHKAYVVRWRTKIQSMKINLNGDLQRFIISELERIDRITSPKSIAFEWNQKQSGQIKPITITHESIYKWLEKPAQDKYRKYLLYKNGYKTIPTTKGSKIIGRIGLEKRPIEAEHRTALGHYEADLVVSHKGSKAAILTLIDRKSRLPRILKLQNKGSQNIMDIIASIKDEIGIKSVTFDNGMEFAYHHQLHDIGIDTYFCEPYHSREKGSIENLNRIIRRWFPKGTDFSHITNEEIQKVCSIIADSPREILGFKSPNQVHFE